MARVETRDGRREIVSPWSRKAIGAMVMVLLLSAVAFAAPKSAAAYYGDAAFQYIENRLPTAEITCNEGLQYYPNDQKLQMLLDRIHEAKNEQKNENKKNDSRTTRIKIRIRIRTKTRIIKTKIRINRIKISRTRTRIRIKTKVHPVLKATRIRISKIKATRASRVAVRVAKVLIAMVVPANSRSNRSSPKAILAIAMDLNRNSNRSSLENLLLKKLRNCLRISMSKMVNASRGSLFAVRFALLVTGRPSVAAFRTNVALDTEIKNETLSGLIFFNSLELFLLCGRFFRSGEVVLHEFFEFFVFDFVHDGELVENPAELFIGLDGDVAVLAENLEFQEAAIPAI